MGESKRSKPPVLGRKPNWQLRWETRSQRKFDQQSIKARAWEARHADVRTPDGQRYFVRTVANGEMLRQLGSDGGTGLELPVVLLIALLEAVRKRRRSGWTIGVVRAETTWRNEKVLFRETVSEESEIAPRVRELAEAIERGAVPGVS